MYLLKLTKRVEVLYNVFVFCRKGRKFMFVLFTDTDTDMTPSICKEYGYNLISMPYTIDDKEIYPYVDFDEFDGHAFYQKLREGAMPKTSAISPVQYMEYFEPFFKEGKDILYVHFSAAMSGTFNAMEIAYKQLKEKYPERTLHTIDTKGMTILSYIIVREIGEMYLQGKSVEEIKAWAEKEVDKFAIYLFVEDLSFFKRSGRVKSFVALVGNILKIHPIIHVNEEGCMVNIDKCRGKNATINKIVEMVKANQEDIKGHRCVVAHTDAFETAKALADKLKEELGQDLEIEFVETNPTLGSHAGPDAVGVAFHAKGRKV